MLKNHSNQDKKGTSVKVFFNNTSQFLKLRIYVIVYYQLSRLKAEKQHVAFA
jgi:hypothetical protein